MRKTLSQVRKRTSSFSRPEDIIIGTDPLAVDLLKQIYAALKDRGDNSLNFLEKCWVMGIEEAYRNGRSLDPEKLRILLKQVCGLLEEKKAGWDEKDEELYEILEKVISLKANGNLKSFFDEMIDTVSLVSQLDFSKRIPLSDLIKDKRNIFNYIVLMFNMIIEKMEASVVSMKTVNCMCSLMPETMFMITDINGRIRFINDYGELLLCSKRDEVIGKKINDLIYNFDRIQEKMRTETIKESMIELIVSQNPQKTLSLSLSILNPIQDKTEIEEFILVLKPL